MAYTENQAKLVGVWKLLTYTTSNGDSTEISYPYGKEAKGYLIYTPEGFVSVHIMRALRTQYPSSEEEKIEASENFGGYVGRYEIRGNHVTHYPEITGFLSYIQKPQTRSFQLSGNVLTLEYFHSTEEHSLVQNTLPTARSQLTWERVCS